MSTIKVEPTLNVRKRTHARSFPTTSSTPNYTKRPTTAARRPSSSSVNISHLPLREDHMRRPLWVFPYTARKYLDHVEQQDKRSSSSSSSSTTTTTTTTTTTKNKKKSNKTSGECRVIVETFSPHYDNTIQFLVAIGEPCSRPTHIHEWRLTADSLFSAVALGVTPQEIIRFLGLLSKTELHPDISKFILTKCKSAGQLYKVLENGQYYIETTTQHRGALKRLRAHLQQQARTKGAEVDVLQSQTRIIEECNDWLNLRYENDAHNAHQTGYRTSLYPWRRTLQRCTQSNPAQNSSIYGTLTVHDVVGMGRGDVVVYQRHHDQDVVVEGLVPGRRYKIKDVYPATNTVTLVAGHHPTVDNQVRNYCTCWWYFLCNFQYRQHYEKAYSDHFDC